MLKTLEKKLVWKTVQSYWKQFVVLVTDLRSKYLNDIFFRTEFNVISLQIVFAVVLSIFIIIFFNYLYKDILETLVEGIRENINTNGAVSSTEILNSIKVIRAKNFFSFFSIAVSITLVFSYIIAKMTLSPTREALKSQKRFVSDVAHELRTPLSVIKTNSEVALLSDNMDVKTRKIFKNNIEELDRVSGIINNLLTFSSLVHPEHIKFAPVDLGEIVDNSIIKLSELAENKEIKLTVKKISPYTVYGNSIALEQITINIIKNAINYNRSGGAVTVRVGPDYRGNIVLAVEDNGIGISQEDLLHIFEPFYRAERSRKKQAGSSGLGLTIVSELVKIHSGRISVSSHLKQGTTVTIILPYIKNRSDSPAEKSHLENEVSIDFLKQK